MIKLKDLIKEGFMGWEHHGESDTASDHFHTLQDRYKKHKGNPEQLTQAVNKWLRAIKRDRGNDWNLDGAQALGLIAKDKEFAQIMKSAPKSDIKAVARWAADSISKNLVWLKRDHPEQKDEIKGKVGMVKALKKWS